MFELGDAGKVLIVKQHGEITALGTKCTHYGALLSTGALGEGRIRCPFHGACFNIKTGDIEDFPGQDSIPCYKVSIEGGMVKVRAKRSEVENNKRTKPMVKQLGSDERTFVVVGGGPSGAICAETLRQEGFTGRIILVCKEPVLPYDRVKVSKAMDFEVSKWLLRTQDFYDEHNIETLTGVEAKKLDSETKEIHLSNGTKVKYDKIYIATGSRAIKTDIPGADLEHVVVLRDHAHSQFVNKELGPDKHVVCLGVSFTGLEAAAYSVSKVAKVTVIGRGSVPFKPIFGEEVGQQVMDFFIEKGVNFIMNSGIKRCIAENGRLTSVELNDGSILKADICVMGVGSSLYTEFLRGSGVIINPNGSIDTDLYLETNIRDIYVGGDIANAPVFSLDQRKVNIGHYPLAQYHGRIAALNMVAKRTALSAVPFFWTVLFGKSFRYAGHGVPADCKIYGDLKELKYFAFYFDENDKVIAMSSCQKDPIVAQFAEFLSQGRSLYRNQLTTDSLGWVKEIAQK